MKTTLQTIATVFFIGVFASAQVKLDSGLAAYYPFDNDTKDYSGNNRHSLSNNAAFVTGRSTAAEKAISYDGSTFSVLPISFTITSATISFWFKPKSYVNPNVVQRLFSIPDKDGSKQHFSVNFNVSNK